MNKVVGCLVMVVALSACGGNQSMQSQVNALEKEEAALHMKADKLEKEAAVLKAQANCVKDISKDTTMTDNEPWYQGFVNKANDLIKSDKK